MKEAGNEIFSWLILLFIILIASCTSSNQALNGGDGVITNRTATPILSATTSATATPFPSATATATTTFTPTFTFTPTLPSAILTPLPDHSQVIDVMNVGKMTKLAHWGIRQLYSLRLSDDGTKIIATLNTGIRIFDAKSLVEISRLDTLIPDEYSVRWAISSNGERLAVLDENAKLSMWDLKDGKKLGLITLDRNEDVGCASDSKDFVFSPDNNSIGIFGFCNGGIRNSRLLLIRVADLRLLAKLNGIGQRLFSPDGKYLAACS